MTTVGINGLGRIGRLLARRMYERDDARHALELAMCNEVADVETVVHLLKYDSTHGRFSYPVAFDKSGLQIADRRTRLSHEIEHRMCCGAIAESTLLLIARVLSLPAPRLRRI